MPRKGLPAGRERRRYRRFPVRAPAGYRIVRLPSPARMIKLLDSMRHGTTRNISRGGACLQASALILPGTIIDVRLPSSPAGRPGMKRARVVWTREISPNRFLLGVRFLGR